MPATARTVLVLSGGLDSTVLLHHLRAEGSEVLALSFDYGQRHARELDAARRICATTDTEHEIVKLDALALLSTRSGLVNRSIEIPSGPYSDQNVPVTEVPNRNMVMVAIAASWAKTRSADAVAIAVHGGSHVLYADCTPPFVETIDAAVRVATDGKVKVVAPFVRWTKTDIVRRGAALRVDFALTWSCYRGGDQHCGDCGTCQERQEAFAEAGVVDPTVYASAAR